MVKAKTPKNTAKRREKRRKEANTEIRLLIVRSPPFFPEFAPYRPGTLSLPGLYCVLLSISDYLLGRKYSPFSLI